jgi:uncharacterized protein (TIGR02118 family)
MIKLLVVHQPPEDAAAFDGHCSTHAPLAQKIPGLRRCAAGKVLGTPNGTPPPLHFMAELSFDGTDDLRAGERVRKDVGAA